jgi:hypothetical protein
MSEEHDIGVLKYQLKSILMGLVCLTFVALERVEILYFLLGVNFVELVGGLNFNIFCLMIGVFNHPLKLYNIPLKFSVPPKPVLITNSIIQISLVVGSIFMHEGSLKEHTWIPMTLYGVFSILVGTTGICPVAIMYGMMFNKKIEGCGPEETKKAS